MRKRSSKSILAEARDLWADSISFQAALSVRVREAQPGAMFPSWQYLTTTERRWVAEGMLEMAISRQRAGHCS